MVLPAMMVTAMIVTAMSIGYRLFNLEPFALDLPGHYLYVYIYIYTFTYTHNAGMYVCLYVCMYMPLFSSAYMEDRVLKINHGACNMVTFLFALHGGAGRSRANQAESDRGGISC